MGVVIPWALLMSLQAYRFGIAQGRLPEPYYFIAGSAVMGVAAIIAQANDKVGTLFAWAMLSGALVLAWRSGRQTPALQTRMISATLPGSAGSALPTTQTQASAGTLKQGGPR
jgi:hypothetical protein